MVSGARAVLIGCAMAVAFGCVGRAADDGDAARWIFFSGGDIWHNGGFMHGGTLWSPYGLDRPGFTLKTVVSGGDYRYISGALNDATVRGQEAVVRLMPGWRFKSGKTEVTVFAGLDIENHRLRPDDPGSNLRGTDTGIRIAVDYWTEPTATTMAQLNAAASTIDGSYLLHAAFGWRAFDTFYVGPDAARFASGGYEQTRIGLHVTALHIANIEWSAGAGWALDSDNRSGPYFRVGLLTRR